VVAPYVDGQPMGKAEEETMKKRVESLVLRGYYMDQGGIISSLLEKERGRERNCGRLLLLLPSEEESFLLVFFSMMDSLSSLV